jgi:hypothetical protein
VSRLVCETELSGNLTTVLNFQDVYVIFWTLFVWKSSNQPPIFPKDGKIGAMFFGSTGN